MEYFINCCFYIGCFLNYFFSFVVFYMNGREKSRGIRLFSDKAIRTEKKDFYSHENKKKSINHYSFYRAVHIKKNSGAIILEYVLLLVACLGCAIIIKKAVEISGSEEDSGWIIRTWIDIIKIIAEDM